MESLRRSLAAARRKDEHLSFHPTAGRVLVVEEHPLTATGLQLALSERGWNVETTSGPSAADVIHCAEAFQPQCVLTDARLGDEIGSGIDLIGPLASTGARVVMLTAERRRMVLAECLEAGAVGWISKGADLDEVDSMLGQVVAGRPIIGRTVRATLLDHLRNERAREQRMRAIFDELTEREAHVLAALTDGLSADEIACEHFVAVTTVRSQIRGVLRKLGVRSQLAAVAIADAHRQLLPDRGEDGRDRRRAPSTSVRCDDDASMQIA